MLDIIECPRDAMQGIDPFIPTADKVHYINTLLKVGFHTIDAGSFVSAKAIPQMADTAEVLSKLDRAESNSRILAIVANKRGANDAANHEQVDILGYPFSISEVFQERNTRASIEESLLRVDEIKSLCDSHQKKLVVYISMAFGNPYGETWHPDIAIRWAEKLHTQLGIETLSLSDTIGSSNRSSIDALFSALIPALPGVEFGAHLHTTPSTWREKVDAAYQAGCRRFDGAIKGFGGCPMAADALTGNMPTENILAYAKEASEQTGCDDALFASALKESTKIFH